MNTTILCYPACGTCKRALQWLNDNFVDYAYRPIKEENPTVDELTQWIALSNLPVTRFFNTSGKVYKDLNMKDKVRMLPDEKLIEMLAADGLLVKRPLLVTAQKVLVGFKQEEWEALLHAK